MNFVSKNQKGRVIREKPFSDIKTNILAVLNKHKTISPLQIHSKNSSRLRSTITDFYDDETSDKCSVNLSLLSLKSDEFPERIKYGKIGHYSPFERFVYFKNHSPMYQNIEMIKKYLKHYTKLKI